MSTLNSNTAFIFPGQGSQFVEMGRDLAEHFHVARQTIEEADDILGYRLSSIMFDGPEDTLTETSNAQPALYTAGIAALRTLYEELDGPFQPRMVAGHSLGELTALTAAGALAFPDGLKLVRRRGELMRDADRHSPGGMAAILALNLDEVQAACAAAEAATGGTAVVANDNCPGQVVIAGDEETLIEAMTRTEDMGAKRVVRLPVSIAAHSPLMGRAQQEFREALAETPFHVPAIPVVGNTQAELLTSIDAIRAELSDQLTSPVRWTESVQTMLNAGINTFVELGSKDVLCGLIRRIERGTERIAVDSPEDIDTLTK